MSVKTILAALALEEDSDPVAGRAVQLATQHGARLILAHVIEGHMWNDPARPASADGPAMARMIESDAFDRIRGMTEGAAVPAQIFVEFGRPGDAILRLADRCAADLVLIGPGKARNIREKIFGSTADRVVRAASCPVLVVRSPTVEPYGHAVVGVDFSARSRAAARSAAQIAPSATIDLVHAVEIPLAFEQAMLKGGTPPADIERYRASRARAARERLFAEFSDAGRPPRARIRIVGGNAGEALIRSSRRRKVDLVALGAQGLDAVARHMLGSVARKVLAAASCDVLIAPASAK